MTGRVTAETRARYAARIRQGDALTGEQLAATESEASFMARVVALARLNHWKVFHAHRSDHSESGFPDLVMLRRNRLLAWECKSQSGRPTAEQIAWRDAFDGVITVRAEIVRPSDWDAIVRELVGLSAVPVEDGGRGTP